MGSNPREMGVSSSYPSSNYWGSTVLLCGVASCCRSGIKLDYVGLSDLSTDYMYLATFDTNTDTRKHT